MSSHRGHSGILLVVADASSLILLQKCGLLAALSEKMKILLEETVAREAASDDLVEKFPDAAAIADLIKRGKLKVAKARRIADFPMRLGDGERASIELAVERKADRVLTDDGRAIWACRRLGMAFMTSISAVLFLHGAHAISLDVARRALEKLRIFGWFEADLIADALVRLIETKKGGVR